MGRTPWHQDTAYSPYVGGNGAVCGSASSHCWSTIHLRLFSSHQGPQYDGSAYDDPSNPSKPLHGGIHWPPRPDIERERRLNPQAWPILSFPSEPGDVIVFHPHSLHGGAPLSEDCPVRHILILRLFGDDAVYRPLPPGSQSLWGGNIGPREEFRGLVAGESRCCDRFLRLR